MNVYDFDGTIYPGDSTVDFYLYALRRRPALLRFAPRQLLGGILYALKRIDKTQFKERFFCFLAGIDAEAMAEAFWEARGGKIGEWYLRQRRADDVVISASPEFLLSPICRRLGVRRLIASDVDARSGAFRGTNCRGEEKVRRLAAECQTTRIDEFYSDSRSDLPLAKIADRAFRVKKGRVLPWRDF